MRVGFSFTWMWVQMHSKKNADYSRQRVINQSFGFEITRIQFGVWVEKKTLLLAIKKKKHIENRCFPYLACVILNTRLYKASKGRRWRMNHTSHTFCLIYLLSKKTFFSLSPVTSLRCLEKLPHFWARRILFFASLLSFSGYTDPSPFRGIHSHLAPKRM